MQIINQQRNLIDLIDEEISYNVIHCILCSILKIEKVDNIFNIKINEVNFNTIQSIVNEIKRTKIPYQYIINSANFFGYDFFIKQPVLIPRMDSESMIDEALKSSIEMNNIKILDICSGSGCLGISFYLEFQKILKNAIQSIEFIDIDKDAIDVLNVNIEKFHIQNYKISQKNILIDSFLNKITNKSYDIIFFNPPYISQQDIHKMDESVVKFESHMALFAKNKGLFFYKKILPKIHLIMNNKSLLFVEFGMYQYEKILKITKSIKSVKLIKDMAGRNRAAVFKKSS